MTNQLFPDISLVNESECFLEQWTLPLLYKYVQDIQENSDPVCSAFTNYEQRNIVPSSILCCRLAGDGLKAVAAVRELPL